MTDEISANSCRVCLATTKKLRSLYKPVDEGDEPPFKMLHLTTGIQVEELDEHKMLPKHICKNCELSLSMAFEFRVNALKTQQIIMKYLKNLNKNDPNKEKNEKRITKYKDVTEYGEEFIDIKPLDDYENSLDEDSAEGKLDSRNDDELEYRDLTDKEKAECIEHEQSTYLLEEDENNEVDDYSNHLDHQDNEDDELNEYEEPLTNEDQSETNDEQLEEEETMENDNQDYISEYTIVSPKVCKRKQATTVLIKNEDSLRQKAYSNNNNNNTKQIPRRGRKPANTNNHVGYMCDICGNIFSKKGRLTEHRQRHDKALKFNCEVCTEKFCTRELLRRHMFSHSGGKPLKCQFCSRTFYYESVRKAHEAVHKGHKPFVCNVCGKAFGYAHALKKHNLIHAEIKLYRCEYCNKDFRLQHHMKQHELTKLHQNAVRFVNANFKLCVSAGTNNNDIIEKGENLNDNILFIEEITEDQLANGS